MMNFIHFPCLEIRTQHGQSIGAVLCLVLNLMEETTILQWQRKQLLPIITGVLISFCGGGGILLGLFHNLNPWQEASRQISSSACIEFFPCIVNANECWLIVARVTQLWCNKYTPEKGKRPLEFRSNQSQISEGNGTTTWFGKDNKDFSYAVWAEVLTLVFFLYFMYFFGPLKSFKNVFPFMILLPRSCLHFYFIFFLRNTIRVIWETGKN